MIIINYTQSTLLPQQKYMKQKIYLNYIIVRCFVLIEKEKYKSYNKFFMFVINDKRNNMKIHVQSD